MTSRIPETDFGGPQPPLIPGTSRHSMCGHYISGGVTSFRCSLGIGHTEVPREDPEPHYSVSVYRTVQEWQAWAKRQWERQWDQQIDEPVVCPGGIEGCEITYPHTHGTDPVPTSDEGPRCVHGNPYKLHTQPCAPGCRYPEYRYKPDPGPTDGAAYVDGGADEYRHNPDPADEVDQQDQDGIDVIAEDAPMQTAEDAAFQRGWDAAVARVETLCAQWDVITKGQSPTTAQIRAVFEDGMKP